MGRKMPFVARLFIIKEFFLLDFTIKLVFFPKKIAASPCWSNLSQNQQFKDLIIWMNRVNLICKDISGLEQLDKAAMLVDKTVQVPVNIFIPEFARKNLFSSQWRGTLLFLSTNMAAVKSAMQFRIPTTISRVQRKSVLQLCYLGCCN